MGLLNRQISDDNDDVVNTTFSEMMIILIFITLVFIGSDFADLSSLNSDYQISKEKIAELEEALRQLASNQADMDSTLLSTLVNFNGSMQRGGYDLSELDLSEIEQIAEFLIFLRNRNIDSESLVDFLRQAENQGYTNLDRLFPDLVSVSAQVSQLQQLILTSGNGLGVCWADSGESASEFIFDVVSLDESFLVVPSWNAGRQEEILVMPGMDAFYLSCKEGCYLTDQEFENIGIPLRNYSRNQSNIGGIPCYLPVRYFENTELNTGDKLLLSQRYFATAVRFRNREYTQWRIENGLEAITTNQ